MESIKKKTLEWLATGSVGMSSKAMAMHLCGFKARYAHPHDPSDFNRCLLYLYAVPEARQDIHKMAELSSTWAALVDNWDKIERSFVDEVGINWSSVLSAPKTYKMMRGIIDKAQSQ